MALSAHESPSSFTPHLFQYVICRQIHEAMSLGAQKRHLEDYELITILHDRVLSLISGLPPVHRPVSPDISWDSGHPQFPKQRQQIATAAYSFLMALRKPHAKTRATSRDAAIEAALSILDAQERLLDLMATQYYSIYALCVYTVDAAIFLSVTTVEHPPSDPAKILRTFYAIEKAMYRLELARERFSLAASALQILKPCYIKMQPLSHQLHTSEHTVQLPSQISPNFPYRDTQLGGLSDHYSQGSSTLPEQNSMPIFDPEHFHSAAMFDEITMSNFDIVSWVQDMNKSNNFSWQ
ncbi:uncharacterized protein N7529_007000 [Penicillium soppii]|uniref:uncharacterized protein n=1 Tax=Penicillium soppii TaxID=69789 RepID=UPI0025469F69|nr:uncharacterized protein N7529_007000 [Penicillium soppii]KAJ5865084.1 hypothetical protein N7529_007000 [Penicillium soppii]